MPPDVRRDGQAILEERIQRKLRHFAGNRRLIVDYKLTQTPTGPHLAVISTPLPD